MPGDSSSSGGLAVRSAPVATAPVSAGGRGLPAGVSVEQNKDYAVYRFSVGGKDIRFVVEDTSKRNSMTVSFDVGGTMDRGSLKGRDADRVALTVARIFKHDIASRPDGFKYQTTSYTGDNFGDKRAELYSRVGFSEPSGGTAGGGQYGIVKNGKLVADLQRYRSDDYH